VADHAAGSGKPLKTGTVYLSPEVATRRAHALTRRAWWTFIVFLVGIWAPLLSVAWQVPWTLWIALAVAMGLVPWFGRVMAQLGWEQRDLDEQIRTAGGWRVTGHTLAQGRVVLTGHLVYTSHDQVGALTRPLHVDLDAIDD
jgi:hypothetical protein